MVHLYIGRHEIGGEWCDPKLHCHSCDVDEEGPAYIGCCECGHLYRTARDLRRAYRRAAWRAMRKYARWWEYPHDVLHILFRRAGDISFCQECSHDF